MDVDQILSSSVSSLGYADLKLEQKQAIKSFIQKKDVFVILPTGFGKSLCYGCLPLVYDSLKKRKGSIVIVISPLIVLMEDQVEKFSLRGLSAVWVGPCSKEVHQQVINGEYQLVFISPESILSKSKWRKMLLSDVYQNNVVGLAIDEAHCVRKW